MEDVEVHKEVSRDNGVQNGADKVKANAPESDKEVTYDDLLSSAGEFGIYQALLFLSTLPFYLFGVFSYFDQLFITETPSNYWCRVPELENLTDIQRRNLAIPADDASRFGYSQCSVYVANWSEVLMNGLMQPNQSWPKQACPHGWEFNKTEIPYPTIASDFGWVCEKDSYQATAQSIFFVGSIVGGFIIGWVADRYGRLSAAAISNVIGGVAGIVSIFVTDFIQFAVCRFFMGMSWDNSMMMVYLLVIEYVAPKYRTLAANMPFAVFYTLGVCALPWIALACGHWKTFSLVTCIPMLLAVLAPFVMPESPRWLLSKGRVDDAIEKVMKIAQVNKKAIPSKLVEDFRVTLSKQKQETTTSILELFKRPTLRKMFICMCLEYMCCMVVFDALIRSIGGLNFDFFLSFTVLSFTEFPSLVIVSFILDPIGRKWLSISMLTVSCIFSILTAFLGGGLPSVLCAVVARFAVNMNVNTAMQWGAEMLPATVRGSSMSIIHICGYVATVISPFIVYLEMYYTWLPLLVVGCVAGFGALIILDLPETSGKEMPQTFDDAEELITSSKFFEVPCLQKKKNKNGHDNNSFEM